MKKYLLLATVLLMANHALAHNTHTLSDDTTKVIDLEEVVIISTPKETSKLKQLPASVSLLSKQDMQAHQDRKSVV